MSSRSDSDELVIPSGRRQATFGNTAPTEKTGRKRKAPVRVCGLHRDRMKQFVVQPPFRIVATPDGGGEPITLTYRDRMWAAGMR